MMKKILSSDTVLASFDPVKETRVYVDHGPTGLGATLAQLHEVDGLDHKVWRPVRYNSRAMVSSELNYGKVDGESLSVLFGIKIHKDYLYGTRFEVVTDHKPLVSIYNNPSRELKERVVRHKSKLQGIQFQGSL